MTINATPPGAPPAELIVKTAQGLGYWPEHSLVLVLSDGIGQHCLSARCDLADIAADPDGWRHYLSQVIARSQAVSGEVMLYEPEGDAHWQTAAVAVDAMSESALTVRDVVVARRRGEYFEWTSLECADDEGSPWRQQPWPQDPDRPCSWRKTRADLEGELTPQVPGWLAAVAASLDEADCDLAIAQVVAWLCDGEEMSDEAMLLTTVADVRARDTILWDILNRPRACWGPAAERLAPTVRRAAPGHVAPAATILGVLRWQAGDGTRAGIALDRALADDPEYTLAQLIDGCLRSGMSPTQWREGLNTLSRADCRRPC